MMFQVILGIALSVILLFVITLLLTEVAATYPMMNRYERNIFTRFNDFLFRNAEDRNKARLLLIVLSCILGLCIMLFFIGNAPDNKRSSENLASTIISPKTTETPSTNRTFADTVSEYGMNFSLKTKWEDGKIYCNAFVRFQKQPIWSFKDWSFYLLDNDDFLVKKFNFTVNDLLFETRPGGGIIGLTAKANSELTMQEYQKIKSLKVVLDKKITVTQ